MEGKAITAKALETISVDSAPGVSIDMRKFETYIQVWMPPRCARRD